MISKLGLYIYDPDPPVLQTFTIFDRIGSTRIYPQRRLIGRFLFLVLLDFAIES